MTKEELIKLQKQRDKETVERLRAKYGNMTEEQLDAELIKGIEFQMQSEQKEPTNKIDFNSPKQRRIFEKMGTILKVKKPTAVKEKFMNLFSWVILVYVLTREFIINRPIQFGYESKIAISIVGLVLLAISLKSLFIRNGLKSFDKITRDSLFDYIKVSVLLVFSNMDSLGNIGIFAHLIISSLLLALSAFTLVREVILNRKSISASIIIGHTILCFLFFSWSKNTYVRNYGTEEIGSYWEKPNYTTKYLVRISESSGFEKSYALQSQIRVFKEQELNESINEDEFGREYRDSYTRKFIHVEKIFWPNGGYLKFDECDINDSNYCIDQNGKGWYIKIESKL